MFKDRIKKQIRNISSKINKSLYRDIIVYGPPTEYDCPNCFYSLNDESSTGIYDTSFTVPTTVNGRIITPTPFTRGRCPICRGAGKIEFENKRYLNAYILWDPPTDSEGEIVSLPIGNDGNNVVKIKADAGLYEFIRDCRYALIDEVRCELIRPPVVRSLGDHTLFTVAYFSSSEVGSSTKR